MDRTQTYATTLDKYLKRRGVAAAELAQAIGVDPAQISRWRRGAVPGLIHALRLQEVTRGAVKAKDWMP